MKKMILVVLLAVFSAIWFVPEAVAGGTDQENGYCVEFYVSTPPEINVLPGEGVYAQYGIQPTNDTEITVARVEFMKGQLFNNFHWNNSKSNLDLRWNSIEETGQEGLRETGSLYFESSSSNDHDSFVWLSNSERGLEFFLPFTMSFTNIAPVGTSAEAWVVVNTVFSDKTIGYVSSITKYVAIDGLRGDVDGTNEITQEDVDLLAFYQPTWLNYNGRFTKTGLNYGRGCVLFPWPDPISAWLLNIYVHNPNNPILEGLGIGRPMSETAYVHTDADAVTSATSVGKIAGKSATITRNIPFVSTVSGNSLTVKTSGDVVNVSANLPSGERWQDTKWTNGGEAQFKLPDSNLKYRIDVVKLPGRQVATSVEESAPTLFTLGQNYPNPFNPSTTIPFTLREASNVKLDVFNSTGQKVDTLVNGRMNVGVHSVQWRPANGLASGTYIVRLQAGQHVSNQRVMFTK